jgi:hypothetical protein
MDTHYVISRRHLLAAALGAPAVGVLVAACGDGGTTDSGSSIEHGTASTDVVMRLGYVGGFVPRTSAFANLPMVMIVGDGRLIQPGAQTEIYPQPLLAPMFERTISEAGVQKVLALAEAAKLLQTPPDYSAEINVADVPDTVLDFSVRGTTFHHQAFALGMEEPGKPVSPSRAALGKFVELMGDVEAVAGTRNLGPSSPLKADSYRIWAIPLSEEEIAGYQPAPTIVDWPSTTDVALADASKCVVIPAVKVANLFADATQLTFFKDEAVVYEVAAVGLLPGDTC